MYYIVVYDIAAPKRLPKILKCCRKFLIWVQKSVFEGEMTRSQYLKFMQEMKKIIDKKEDSVIMYSIRNAEVISKEVYGREKNEVTNFL